MTRTPNLHDISPEEAVETYLKHRESELSKKTLEAHGYRLAHFPRWAEENGITSMAELTPRHLQDYRHWRRREGDLNEVSVRTQMSTIRVFIKWAGDYDAVQPNLYESVRVPQPDDNSRDEKIEAERVDKILDYFEKYEYASRKHVLFAVLWHTGIRIGTAYGLDLGDFHPRDQYLDVVHRPEDGTPLKNKQSGERPVALNDKHTKLLKDYIEARRHDVTDENGREPLFTTKHGRAARGTLRKWVYSLARPCVYTDSCPHDREIDDCDAAGKASKASGCPSSFSPHTVRHTSITYWLMQYGKDEAGEAVSKRMNVNRDVIEKHYDERTELEKLEQRRDLFD